MPSKKQDWLSAAIDEQGLSNEHLDALLQDQDLQHRFERYHMIGSAIRQELPKQLHTDFAEQFAAKLANEPIHQLQSSHTFMQRIKLGAQRAANSDWFKPSAQTAIAAGVALMAVVGVQHYQQPGAQDLMSPLPVLQTRPVAGFASPVSLSQTSVDSRFEQQAQQAMLEQQTRLQELLNAHHQQVRVLDQAQIMSEQRPEPRDDQEPDGQL